MCATGIWWIKVRDAIEHPIMFRTVPTTKNYVAEGVPRLRNPELNNGCWE